MKKITIKHEHGHCDIYINSANCPLCVIANLEVSPKFRRNGFGTKLITDALAISKSLGFDRVCLRTEINSIAAKLYKKLGFRKFKNDSESPSYMWMVKDLS